MTAPDGDLLRQLGDAVRDAEAVPDRFRAAARAAYGWRTVDAELAELLADTTAPPAGSRAGAPASRTLRYRAGGLTVELELTAEALQGQLVPAGPGRVTLETQQEARAEALDDVGWFLFTPPPAAPFRLRITPGSGRAVVTSWTVPGVSAG